MGNGFTYTCKCKNTGENYCSLGVGMLYPSACQRVLDEMRAGKHGEDWKDLLAEHPDGCIDCETVIYKCSACGHWEEDTKNSYYVRKDGKPCDASFYIGWDPEEAAEYRCIKKYSHKCPGCGRQMHIANPHREELVCRKCHSPIEIDWDAGILWD